MVVSEMSPQVYLLPIGTLEEAEIQESRLAGCSSQVARKPEAEKQIITRRLHNPQSRWELPMACTISKPSASGFASLETIGFCF